MERFTHPRSPRTDAFHHLARREVGEGRDGAPPGRAGGPPPGSEGPRGRPAGRVRRPVPLLRRGDRQPGRRPRAGRRLDDDRAGGARGGPRAGPRGAAQGLPPRGGAIPDRVPPDRAGAVALHRPGRHARAGPDPGRGRAGAGAAGEVGPIGPRPPDGGQGHQRPPAEPGRAGPPVDDRLGGDDGPGAAPSRRPDPQGAGPRAPADPPRRRRADGCAGDGLGPGPSG